MTIDKVGGSDISKHAEIWGKSTRTKPIDNGINENDLYIELDTGNVFYYDNDNGWQPCGGE